MAINKNEETQTDKDAGRHRLQLDFSQEAYERLAQIKEKSEARTNAEVVRNALRLYEWFLDLKRKNAKIHVVEGDAVKEVEFLF